MKNTVLILLLSLLNTGAFAAGFGELKEAADARTPAFELPQASPAAIKQYDYNFRCMAGPSTPQYTAPYCYLYTAKGQQACQNAGCNWGIGGTPLPSFHCAAASFTPQHVRPYCYLYTAQGRQSCVNAGCSWTFGTKSAAKKNTRQNAALRKIKLLGSLSPDAIIAKLAKDQYLDDLGVTDGVVPNLELAGFKFEFVRGGAGEWNWEFIVDASGTDAAKTALDLAQYSYFDEVLVSGRVYDLLLPSVAIRYTK